MRLHLEKLKSVHDRDLAEGLVEVYLPYALERKHPNAGREWGWHYVFTTQQRSMDPISGKVQWHYVDEKVFQRAVKKAVREAEVTKPASCHTFRTASQLTCLRQATTSTRCRSFWGQGCEDGDDLHPCAEPWR